jgi:uncharacterized protein
VIDSPPEAPLRPTLNFTVAWTVFGLISFLIAGSALQLMNLAWGLWVSEIILLGGLAAIGYQLIGFRPLAAMGLQRFDARSFGWGFAFGVINFFAWAAPLMAGARAIFPKSMVDQFDSAHVFERATTIELALILVGVCVAAPVGEELFFRGFFQRGLEVARGGPRAIVVTAFVFSAFHLDPVGLTARFELGVLFGLLAWRAGSLWPAIAAHAANNLVSSLLFLSTRDQAEDVVDMDWRVPVMMWLVGNAVLLALVRSSWDRLPAPEPMAWVDAPLRSPAKRFAPWVLAGCAAVGLLLAIDLRGVRLNLLDAQLQVRKPLRERGDVKQLRARVRHGAAEQSEYEAKIRSLQ